MNNQFFELIQVAVSQRDTFTVAPKEEEWEELFQMAKKQCLLGVCFMGIERLPKAECPQRRMVMRWIANSDHIEDKNKEVSDACLQVTELFHGKGYESCILKGQGIASYYPNPARRTSGDIDIWVSGGRKKVLEYIRPLFPTREVIYHHMDFPIIKGVPVEVHFTPSWMNNPFRNHALQQWFRSNSLEQFSNLTPLGYSMPTVSFNAVYVLIHIYRHLFDEGVGLRQLLDYFYVLKQLHDKSPDAVAAVNTILSRLGMSKFAGATMYVLQQVFLMPREWMICEPIESRGEFLLREVMMAGNFGKYDLRSSRKAGESKPRRLIRRISRSLRFLRQYPSEILWFPFFTIVHRIWRQWNGYLPR